MARPRRTSPNAAARRARALEMLATGATVAATAKKLGVSAESVKSYQRSMRAEIEAATTARIEGIKEGAVEAKALLVEATPEAARKVRRIMRKAGDTPGEAQIAKVELAAALAVLDRGGVPAKSEVGGEGLDAIAQALLSARASVPKPEADV